MQLQHVLSVILYHLVQYFLSRTIVRTMAGDTLACARLSDSKIRRARLGKGGGGGGPVSPQLPRVFFISFYWTTFHHYLGAWNRLVIPGNLGIIFTGDTQYPLSESGDRCGVTSRRFWPAVYWKKSDPMFFFRARIIHVNVQCLPSTEFITPKNYGFFFSKDYYLAL